MGFQLVPRSVILNDPERRNGHYFTLFRRIRWLSLPSCSLAINRSSPEKCHKVGHKHDGRAVLFAVAELLVILPCTSNT